MKFGVSEQDDELNPSASQNLVCQTQPGLKVREMLADSLLYTASIEARETC